jgi:hypothetical protein
MHFKVDKSSIKEAFFVSGVIIQGYIDPDSIGPVVRTKLVKAFSERRRMFGWGEAAKIFRMLANTYNFSEQSGLSISPRHFSCPDYADSKLQELFLHAVIKDMTLRKMHDSPSDRYYSEHVQRRYEHVVKEPCGEYWDFMFPLSKEFVKECIDCHVKLFNENLGSRAELFDKLSQALKNKQRVYFEATN